MRRNRILYLILTIILGLLSRKIQGLPQVISSYSGDILLALMVFLGIALILNKKSTKVIATIAIVFSYGIELSQLYHAPWIDTIRSNCWRCGGLNRSKAPVFEIDKYGK